MQLCGVRSGDGDIWRHTGADYENACALDVAQLLRAAQARPGGPVFYDVYYVDRLDASGEGGVALGGGERGAPVLYPVPVVLSNLAANAQAAARLTRRLFVADAELGRAAGGGEVAFVQYSSSIRLEILVRHAYVLMAVAWHAMYLLHAVLCDARAHSVRADVRLRPLPHQAAAFAHHL